MSVMKLDDFKEIVVILEKIVIKIDADGCYISPEVDYDGEVKWLSLWADKQIGECLYRVQMDVRGWDDTIDVRMSCYNKETHEEHIYKATVRVFKAYERICSMWEQMLAGWHYKK